MPTGRVVVALPLLLGALALGGCPSEVGDARDLAVSSDARARVVVEDALTLLRAGRLDEVLARFCDQSETGLARARALLLPGVGQRTLAIHRVEPAWVGAEPWFFVEIGSDDGRFEHGLGVQVKTGCLERAVGAADGKLVDDDAGAVDAGPAVPTPAADAGSLSP